MKFEGTKTLPYLDFDLDKGMIKIWGRSIDVEAKENFWIPLIEKLDSYLEDPRDMVVCIELEFFSTLSSKALLEMFKLIEQKTVKDNNRKFLVEWFYDDEELLEAGEDYQSMLPKTQFKFIKK